MTSTTTQRSPRMWRAAAGLLSLVLLCPAGAWSGPLLYAAGDGNPQPMMICFSAGGDR